MGHRLLWALAALILLVGVAGVWFWPRDDVPRSPDAVVVLGGVGQDRSELGIELAERYDATLVLSSSAAVFGERLGVVCGEDRVLCVEPDPGTTAGEAQMVAALVETHGWDHVTVATSRRHTTRSRVLFRQCLGDDVTVVGSSRSDGEGTQALGRYLREAVATVAALTVDRAC